MASANGDSGIVATSICLADAEIAKIAIKTIIFVAFSIVSSFFLQNLTPARSQTMSCPRPVRRTRDFPSEDADILPNLPSFRKREFRKCRISDSGSGFMVGDTPLRDAIHCTHIGRDKSLDRTSGRCYNIPRKFHSNC